MSYATNSSLDSEISSIKRIMTGNNMGIRDDITNIRSELNLKELLSNKSTSVTTDAISDTKYPSVKAVKTYVDDQLSSQQSNQSNTNTTQSTAISLRELLSNKSTDVVTDASSDAKYPSVKAVKTYVDRGTLSTASTTANVYTATVTTLNIGDSATTINMCKSTTTATSINIGQLSNKANNTVNINGKLIVDGDAEFKTITNNLTVVDKIITLNSGGLAGTAGGSGIEFQEGSNTSSGFIKLGSGRNKYEVKFPPDDNIYEMVTKNASGTITANLTGNVTGNVTGNMTGSVSGSVGSVSGAVGSVSGAVGSVTGNVTGNVTGSVGSVSGAAGSVSGAVGSVSGAVGSVTGNVTGSVGSVTGSVGSVSGNVSGNVTGNVTGSVGSVTGNVSGNVTGNVTGSVGSVSSINSNLSLNNNRIVSLSDPSANQDASTKKYVDERGLFDASFSSVKLGYSAAATGQGDKAVAIGFESLKSNTTGGRNIAIGFRSLLNNTTGAQNTSVGSEALNNNVSGSWNVAIGSLALQDSSFNSSNTAVGYNALNNTKSDNNVAIGSSAGVNNIDGSNNTFIGHNTDCSGNFSYSTAIGTGSRITANNQIALGTEQETVTIPGKLIIPNNNIPNTKSSPGIAGQICYDATYIYICISDGIWNRILLDNSSW